MDDHETFGFANTKGLRMSIRCHITAISAVFILLIVGTLLLIRGGSDYVFLLNLLFYIIASIIGTILIKIMFMSKSSVIVGNALQSLPGVFFI